MSDRITPLKDGGSIEDAIDEIVALDGRVHIEMMNDGSAWMRVGNDVFWIHAKKGKLTIRFSEAREGYPA